MAYALWPAELPQRALSQGFQTYARDNRLSTAMDVGGKSRRRGLLLRPVNCIIITGFDGRARFDRFFEEEIGGGVSPFLFPDQLIDNLPLRTEDGTPLLDDLGHPLLAASWWRVKFGQSKPVISALAGIEFTIQLDLTVLP